MDKYAYDFDDDDDDDTYPPRKKNVGATNDENVNVAWSTKGPPVPVGYTSIGDGDGNGEDDPQSKDSKSVKKAFADKDIVSLDENLGNNFYTTLWISPNIDKAALHKMATVYKEGRSKVRQARLTEDMDIGVGLNLYFQYALSIAVGFFFIFIFSVPTLVFSYFGSAVSPQDQDIVGLYQLTIANIGFDPSSLTYAADSQCSGEPGIVPTVNQTCISVMGNEFTTQSVSLVITCCEILQVCVFFIILFHLRRRFDVIITAHADSGVPSITDYAVQVTNLPRGTTVQEVIEHFSSLYQLETVDFRGRLPVEDAAPVDSIGYSSNEIHVGTWVAECTMCLKMGKAVNFLEKRRALMVRLYDARARMKMYGPKTPHAKGYNARKYERYEKIMLKVATKVDRLNAKIALLGRSKEAKEGDDEESGHSSRPNSANRAKSAKSAKSVKVSFQKEDKAKSENQLNDDEDHSGHPPAQPSQDATSKSCWQRVTDVFKDEPVLGAFVCFEYNESFARCLEDFSFFSYYPMRLFAPSKMLFKGRMLSVKRAPEPDQVVWENIEVGPIQRSLARLRTLVEILVVFIVVYALFAAAADARVKYTVLTPPGDFCSRAMPQLFAGPNYTSDAFLSQMQLTRAPSAERENYDTLCDAVLPESYYAVYTFDGDVNNTVGDYSLSACMNSYNATTNVTINSGSMDGLCPLNSQDPMCPCHTSLRAQECQSLGCGLNNNADNSVPCMQFTSADPLHCYCSDKLDHMLGTGGYVALLSWFGSYMFMTVADLTDECIDYKYYFGASTIAVYLAIIVTYISNKLLRNIILRNVKSEHHTSFDETSISTTRKIFIACYLNMCIIMLVAFGTNTTQEPAVLMDNYLFSGPYTDFERRWYSTVAFYLVVNFIVITFPQFWNKYYDYFVWNRIAKFNAYKEVTERKGKHYPTQYALNQIEVDDHTFDINVRTGETLAWMFTAMTFGAGVPLLLPLCAFVLTMLFRMDKYLFCRYYVQPKKTTAALMEFVLSVLPFAALLRLAFSIYLLSSGIINTTFPAAAGTDASAQGYSASAISLDSYNAEVASLQQQHYLPHSLSFLEIRVFQANTLPLFIFLVLIAIVMAIRRFWNYLPFVVIYKWTWRLMKYICTCNSFRASKTPGFIHPYDLTFHHPDPLRNQEASLSGGYIKYLRHKDDRPFSWWYYLCYCTRLCFTHKEPVLPELGFRWEILEDGDFDVKIKTWPATMQLSEGSIKMTGDQKYTFDLISEQHCNSFNLENIPAYRTAGLVLRKEPFVPIVPAYMEWKKAFEKANKLSNPRTIAASAAADRPKYKLGDDSDQSDDGAASTVGKNGAPSTETSEKPTNKANKKYLKGGKRNTVMPGALPDSDDDDPKETKVTKKPRSVSFKFKEVSSKFAPKDEGSAKKKPSGAKNAEAKNTAKEESSSSSSSSSSSDSSSSSSSSDSDSSSGSSSSSSGSED